MSALPRKGDWIQTITGRQFWPFDPRPEDVCLEDIAHALAHQCRFSGHVRAFYSVAEHSVRVSEEACWRAVGRGMHPEEAVYVSRWGLLHDASEAYLVDVPRPVKHLPEMAPYREAEARLQQVICTHFGLGHFEPPSVKDADKALCATEAVNLLPKLHAAWRQPAMPLLETIYPWSPEEAKARFLARFAELWPGGAP